MKKPQYVPLYPEDFFAGSMFLTARQRVLYAYMLFLQALDGAIRMDAEQLAQHTDHAVSEVEAVLKAKFEFDKDAGGWVNPRMAAEREKSAAKLERWRKTAANARAAKERRGERVQESRVNTSSARSSARSKGSAPELAFATADQASEKFAETCAKTDAKRARRAEEIRALIEDETDPDRLATLRKTLKKYE